MAGGSGEMSNPQFLKKFIREVCTEFFAFVSDKVERGAKTADPSVKDSLCDGSCFFVGYGHKFDVFCKRIRDTKNELFTSARGTERTKEICMYSLVRFGSLR
jgi:hypothetical protein